MAGNNFSQIRQSSLHPHKLTPKRLEQIKAWQAAGAAARRGRRTAAPVVPQVAQPHPAKRPAEAAVAAVTKRRRGVIGSYGRAAAWGVKNLIIPIGARPVGKVAMNALPGYNIAQGARRPQQAPISMAKNRVPGNNVIQPLKATVAPRRSIGRKRG